MKQLNRTNFPGNQYPTKIIQFGEGNFYVLLLIGKLIY